MTTIDFYTHVDDRLAIAARIVAKAAAAHGSARVLTPDAAMTDALDKLMWILPATGFLPHCRMDSPLAAETPVWIDHRLEHDGPAAVLVNLHEAPPPFFSRFERLAEIVGQVWVYDEIDGEWILAVRNRPVTSGDRLSTESGARAEVQVGSATWRLDANSELEVLLEPILTDRADFVTGSRRLGAEDADSRLRWVGVRVFAVLASILTRRKLTDTSFGFRAMRSELATAVTLREPQYQSSELLLGALAIGARVVELPMTMRRRGDGSSKKGPGLVYGANYGRVMTTTWLREYVLRRRASRAWRTPAGRTARTSR